MTKIRQRAFANRIEEYLLHPALSFDQRRFDSSLHSLVEKTNYVVFPAPGALNVKVMRGLSFAEHMELVMILLAHAYEGLEDDTDIKSYSRAISEAIQAFAAPLADGHPNCFLDPSFLLHGLRRLDLAAIVARLLGNGRIIHETLAARADFIAANQGPTPLGNGIQLLMEEGAAEDRGGICCYLTREEETEPHGTDDTYIAKASFFLDVTNREITVITVQGQRAYASRKNRSRDFARLAARLALDPRAYLLRVVAELAGREGFRRIKVIRPAHHPMFIDKHEGFTARYEPVIKAAGIDEENGCYLERGL
ncbi:MAG: hypothetical protein P1P81_06340 [Desulfobulbales bacterium]|nr:hypothetical protein [Desulfobulbales bacterium]